MKGGVTEATNLIVDLRENHNLFCSIVVYPVIPRGEIILRVIPTAAHTLEDVNYTIEAFKSVRDKLESGFYRDKPIPEGFAQTYSGPAIAGCRSCSSCHPASYRCRVNPVLGARTKVIVRPAAGRPCPKRLTASAFPSGCHATAWRSAATMHSFRRANGVAALSADELAARGVPRLDDVVRQWRGRDLRLFLELCPSAAEPLSEEERAERELILRRADAATCGAFAAADASCGCCALAETALRTAYGAGFRQGDVWLIADDAEVFARYGGRSSKVPLCGLSPEGTGRGGVRGLFLHRMRVGSKSDVKRLRKGGRRIVVWDVNSAGDAAAMRAYGVDFIVTDDPESIGGR